MQAEIMNNKTQFIKSLKTRKILGNFNLDFFV
jgi:hypothetical protein